MSEPGEMHPVDKAFYDLTVLQRDAAWREIERLRKVIRDHWSPLQAETIIVEAQRDG